MKRTVLLVLLCGAAVFAAWSAIHAEDESKKLLVVNLTAGKEDMHSVWMGLKLAEHALGTGRDAIVFLNIKAAELASKKLPDVRFGANPNVKAQIALLVTKGGTVMVCPSCAEAMGVAKEDLLAGVELAGPKLFEAMDEHTVVFSY